GESKRTNLSTSLGSSLVGSIYVLDEPSIGLHPRDTNRLISVLKSLRDVGNSVVVVEHEQEMMQAADYIIDIGPEAGSQGGELIYAGDYEGIRKSEESVTGKCLSGRGHIEVRTRKRNWCSAVRIKGARHKSWTGIDVEFPLHVVTVVPGVSGSGKTSLIKQILYPALQKAIGSYA